MNRKSKTENRKSQLIVALDVDTLKQAENLVNILYPTVNIFKVGSQLFTAALEGHNPLQYGLGLVGGVPDNVVFLEREVGHKLLGYELGHHGDLGANGGRGSPRSIEIASSKSITGHVHHGQILRETYTVGTQLPFKTFYMKGNPSNWSHTNALVWPTGTVQLINLIRGDYKGRF